MSRVIPNAELAKALIRAEERADIYFNKSIKTYESSVKMCMLLLVAVAVGFISFEIVTNSNEKEIQFLKGENSRLEKENKELRFYDDRAEKLINSQRDKIVVLEGSDVSND